MAFMTPNSQALLVLKKPQMLTILKKPQMLSQLSSVPLISKRVAMMVAVSATSNVGEKPEKSGYVTHPVKGRFTDELRSVAMKMHTKDQAREGEKEPEGPPLSKWEPTVEGYLKFLVDIKLVFDALERIVDKPAFPEYVEFRNTGLERSEHLAKDLKWFEQQGHSIPEVSSPGSSYAVYLEELSGKNPQAFVCHLYNIYFAHSAGGKIIGKKVAHVIDCNELEFYKWEGDLSELLENVRVKLNTVSEMWNREEKDRCLEESEKAFKFSGDILNLILS